MTQRQLVERGLSGKLPSGQLFSILPTDFADYAGESLELAERSLRTFSYLTEDRSKCNEALADAALIHAIFQRWGKP